MHRKIYLDTAKLNTPRRLGPTVALHHDLNELFYCWIRRLGPNGYAEHFEKADANDFLKFNWYEKEDYLDFEVREYYKPADIWTVSLRSRQTFEYPVVLPG